MDAAVVERSSQPVESFLDTLMAGPMSITKQLRSQGRTLQNEDTVVVQQQAINQLPAIRRCSGSKLLSKVLGCCIILQLSTQCIVVGEEWPGKSQNRCFLVTARQRVRNSVELAGAVLNREVIPK